jgi:hypothetical protein
VCQDLTKESSPSNKPVAHSQPDTDTTLLRNEIEERRMILMNKKQASLQKKTKADIET